MADNKSGKSFHLSADQIVKRLIPMKEVAP